MQTVGRINLQEKINTLPVTLVRSRIRIKEQEDEERNGGKGEENRPRD